MKNYCDLHTHSDRSDGKSTPAQLIEEAVALGLSAIALTDHNTVDGLPEFLAAAEGKDILAIPGVEFSTDYDGTELHLLGLFIYPAQFPTIQLVTRDYLRRKDESNRELVAALNAAGYELDYEKILEKSPNRNINRSQIADAMVEKGYVKTKDNAFAEQLDKNKGFYREPTRPTIWEILDVLTAIGAVPVLAHPFLNLDEKQLRVFLPMAKERGLRGMEVAYSTYDEATAATAARLAEEFGLLPSGGSDYHGANKVGIYMGTGRGNLQVPAEWADDLKAYRNNATS